METIILKAGIPGTYNKFKFQVKEKPESNNKIRQYEWKVYGINKGEEIELPEIIDFLPTYMASWNGNTPKRAASFLVKELFIKELPIEDTDINPIIVETMRKVIDRVDADIIEKELVWFENWHYNKEEIQIGKTMRIIYCPNKLHKHKTIVRFY